jgi:5-methylcytosine-specific restriction endonuclease McrA
MVRKKISEALQRQVRSRAGHLCEYCHASEKWQYVTFTVDHVIPISVGGTNDFDNLALACFHCNRRKWNRLMAIDPGSGKMVKLFNPRKADWQEHFVWSSNRIRLVGLTLVGQVTIEALRLNRNRVLEIRAADVEVGRHPPKGDLVQDNIID